MNEFIKWCTQFLLSVFIDLAITIIFAIIGYAIYGLLGLIIGFGIGVVFIILKQLFEFNQIIEKAEDEYDNQKAEKTKLEQEKLNLEREHLAIERERLRLEQKRLRNHQ